MATENEKTEDNSIADAITQRLMSLIFGKAPSNLDLADQTHERVGVLIEAVARLAEKAKADPGFGPIYDAIMAGQACQATVAIETNYLLREILSRLPNIVDPTQESPAGPEVHVMQVDLSGLLADYAAQQEQTPDPNPEPEDAANVPASDG